MGWGAEYSFPVKETSPLSPGTPYAESKLLAEEAIKRSGANYISLRFFNVVGAHYALKSGNPSLESKNLFSSICKSILKKNIFKIDYNFFPTRDGTAIRDFIDINDISKIIKFDFNPKSHYELGENLGMLDFDLATKTTGSRFGNGLFHQSRILSLIERGIKRAGFSPAQIGA